MNLLRLILFAVLIFLPQQSFATVIISKATADALAAGVATVNNVVNATTIAFVDGGAGNDQITDSGSGLAGFHVGDYITVDGSTSNDGTYEILAVAAGAVDVGTGLLTTEAAGDQVALASARGHSLKDLFKYSVMRIYSGTQPTAPEDAETGTLLLQISESSGTFTGGSDANGLLFDAVVDGVLTKDASQVWSDAGIATGTAAYGRLYDNALDDGADATETAIRIDFSVGLAGDLIMSPSVTLGGTKTIDEFSLTIPLQ